MPRYPAHIRLVVALVWTSLQLLEGSAFAQSPPSDLKSEVDTLKAENAVVRELLRKMEEQQEALLEQVDRMQRRLDGLATAVVQPSGPSQVADRGQPLASDANVPAPGPHTGGASAQEASVEQQEKADHYKDGIVIWENPEDAKVPFLLRLNNNTQIRYLNTTDSADTFTDHLGVVRDVHTRNDITAVSRRPTSRVPTTRPSITPTACSPSRPGLLLPA